MGGRALGRAALRPFDASSLSQVNLENLFSGGYACGRSSVHWRDLAPPGVPISAGVWVVPHFVAIQYWRNR